MLKLLARFLMFLAGWKVDMNFPKEANYCVMTAAPHTSNWDAFYLICGFVILDIPYKFTIKSEWMKPPMGWLLKPLGALGIDRNKKIKGKKSSYVEQMVALFEGKERMAMVIPPEGTRGFNDRWKMGFYHTALKANVPITFGYLDYEKKVAGVGGVIYPTGDIAEDMKKVHAFYSTIAPKYKELFSLDRRYLEEGKQQK